MLISERLEKAINQQVGNEFGASMEYLHIAAYFEGEDMLKFAQIFFEQAAEENEHAMKLLHYVLETGGTLRIPTIPGSKSNFTSPEEAVGTALAWEETVTKQIYGLMDIAVEEKDYIAQEFLGWFVDEQLEEISKMSMILNVIKRSQGNLLMAETYIVDALADMAAAAAAGGAA